jgi:hypothetical protein
MTAMWRYQALALAAGLAAVASPALAEPGDMLEVTTDRANLRSGPSDETTVRSQVLLGDEVIELRREGSWVGVRVMRTGEEGWIYGDLVQLASETQLDGGVSQAGLDMLSADFDRLIGRIGDEFGYSLIESVQEGDGNALYVTPTNDFLVYAGREAHVTTTLAVYQMWKNHQNSEPVSVTLLGTEGEPYVTIQDEPEGAEPTVPVINLASR